ncbi:MAG: hypothetical protein ACQEXQ_21950 [Bacillota bacterium]
MKKKALSLACAIGLSTMLLTACGTTDTNRNTPGYNSGVTTRGTNQGFLLAERDRISNTAEDARMRHLQGSENTGNYYRGPDGGPAGGFKRFGITGYGVNGTTGLNGNAATGNDGRTGTMTSTANALLIGDVLIVSGDGSDNGGRIGVMGMPNRTMGSDRRVWQVTDKGAIKAMNRVQSNLNSMNPGAKASEIGRDLGFILQHVKPAGQGMGMSDGETTANPTLSFR